jgi:death on curing protein
VKKWRWIDKRILLLLHDESLVEHGGPSGLRDDGMLESALARPLNLAAMDKPDLADLAAAYAFGLAKNHPFVDGNKRIALLAVGLFLALNRRRLTAPQADAVRMIFGLAGGEIDERVLATWIREHSTRR